MLIWLLAKVKKSCEYEADGRGVPACRQISRPEWSWPPRHPPRHPKADHDPISAAGARPNLPSSASGSTSHSAGGQQWSSARAGQRGGRRACWPRPRRSHRTWSQGRHSGGRSRPSHGEPSEERADLQRYRRGATCAGARSNWPASPPPAKHLRPPANNGSRCTTRIRWVAGSNPAGRARWS